MFLRARRVLVSKLFTHVSTVSYNCFFQTLFLLDDFVLISSSRLVLQIDKVITPMTCTHVTDRVLYLLYQQTHRSVDDYKVPLL